MTSSDLAVTIICSVFTVCIAAVLVAFILVGERKK